MVQILPSILSADFARLGEQVTSIEAAGCEMFHVDVMDGHFVPNITIGPLIVEALRKVTKAKLDTHLMITEPDKYAADFIHAGSTSISVHQEICIHLDRTLHLIKSLGVPAGVVLNPGTPVSTLNEVLDVLDYVLIMSVNPGFGGQEFISNALQKVRELTARKKDRGLHFPVQIDGGISKKNLPEVIRAGVEWVVAGSSVFHTVNPAATFLEMREIARGAAAAGA